MPRGHDAVGFNEVLSGQQSIAVSCSGGSHATMRTGNSEGCPLHSTMSSSPRRRYRPARPPSPTPSRCPPAGAPLRFWNPPTRRCDEEESHAIGRPLATKLGMIACRHLRSMRGREKKREYFFWVKQEKRRRILSAPQRVFCQRKLEGKVLDVVWRSERKTRLFIPKNRLFFLGFSVFLPKYNTLGGTDVGRRAISTYIA